MKHQRLLATAIFLMSSIAQARQMAPKDCSAMQVWDYSMAMCMPLPMAGMPMAMIMITGNAFATGTFESGSRGRNAFTIPDMFMVDAGRSIGARNYVNLDYMGTLEKWTFPSNGTPELMQVGETQENGQPFLDAQHPHNSPVMGLTLSDTYRLAKRKDHIKVWFAPRGESTDGPIAFMHRPTGMMNPEAPLGHHIGQDVGHISSTVFGGLVHIADSTLELSTFYGREPQPTKVDLPMGSPNSYAARWTQQLTPHAILMASAAFVKDPEPDDPTLDHIWRYSASYYQNGRFAGDWRYSHALIWGLINNFDNAAALNSFADELWVHKSLNNFWDRIEYLQRTPNELQIANVNSGPVSQPDKGRWVGAVTIGYTRHLANMKPYLKPLYIGAAATVDLLPSAYQSAYGKAPTTLLVFFQVRGMKMFDVTSLTDNRF